MGVHDGDVSRARRAAEVFSTLRSIVHDDAFGAFWARHGHSPGEPRVAIRARPSAPAPAWGSMTAIAFARRAAEVYDTLRRHRAQRRFLGVLGTPKAQSWRGPRRYLSSPLRAARGRLDGRGASTQDCGASCPAQEGPGRPVMDCPGTTRPLSSRRRVRGTPDHAQVPARIGWVSEREFKRAARC